MAQRSCLRCGARVGWVGIAVDTSLVGVKLFVGLKTGSRALMANALYSIIDVISAVLVVASFKISRRGVDADHPYGHGKVEYLATAMVSVCVALFAVLLLHGAVDDLLGGKHSRVHPLAALASLLGMTACYLVYRYGTCAGARLDSPLLITHAEHHRADAISSVAVFVSIVLSWVGLSVLDPLVAIVEVGHILYVSVTLFRRGSQGLLDATTDPAQVGIIRRAAHRVPGVLEVTRVRIRDVGATLWVELSVQVSAKRRVSDMTRIRALIRSEIRAAVGRDANVMTDVLPAPDDGEGGSLPLITCEEKK